MKKMLVIMAAGLGSRYGGLKQIDPVGPDGEIIIDYSVYDAFRAGFQKVIFIIRRENLDLFQRTVGARAAEYMRVSYAFQDLEKLPAGFSLPAERMKPWGTGHAVMCCGDQIEGPFAVINADDFYGRDAFQKLSAWMDVPRDEREYAMAGYVLKNTLTKNGHVSRGVCQVDENGYLLSVTERTKIMRINGEICCQEDETWIPLPEDATVSMNCWAFTPDFIKETEKRFETFLRESPDLLKAEFFLPSVVCDMVREGLVRVKVLQTPEKWMGVTYREDKEPVRQALLQKIWQGEYPPLLWKG